MINDSDCCNDEQQTMQICRRDRDAPILIQIQILILIPSSGGIVWQLGR
jgi:hypothetical protein